MSINYWAASGASTWNVAGNWSLSHVPTSGEDVQFDSAHSVQNCTVDISPSVNSVTIASTYTGAWTMAGQTITCALGFSDSGVTGTHNYGNGITCNGASSTLYIDAGVGSVTMINCALVMNGTTGMFLTINKVPTGGIAFDGFKSLTLGASAVVTANGTTTLSLLGSTTVLTLGNNSSLTANNQLYCQATVNQSLYSIGTGVTFKGSSTISSVIPNSYTIAVTIPAITYTGTGDWNFVCGGFNNSALSQFLFTGNLTLLTSNVNIYDQWGYALPSLTFSNITLSCKALIISGYNVAMNGANIACSSFQNTSFDSANYTFNMGTSTWVCTGNWAFGPLTKIISGTSTVTFTTNNATITSAGQAFYSVVFNGSGKTYTLADPMFTNSYTLTAGTIALATYYIYQASTANVWSAAADSTWNTAGNWSLGHVPTSGEDVLFNTTSIKKCTVNISPTVANIGFQNNYSGDFDMTGQTATVSGGWHDAGAGAHNYGNGITVNGNTSSFWVGVNTGAITATSCALTFNGITNCALLDNKGLNVKSLTTGINAIFTSSGAAALIISGSSTLLTLGTGTSFTQSNGLFYTATGPCTVFSIGSGVTWTGAGTVTIINNCPTNNINVPAVTYTGSGNWSINVQLTYNNSTTLTGALAIGSSKLTMYNVTFGTTHTINFNNQNLTCGLLKIGSIGSGYGVTTNYGSGIFTVSAFDVTASLDGNSYTYMATHNFQTSQWTVTGNFLFTSAAIVDPGASLITFTGAGASVVTSAGKSFYDVAVNNASKAFSFADAPSLHNLTTTAMASYTHTGFVLTSSGNVTFNGAGTLNLGNGITMNGTSGALTINSSVGTVTATSCALVFNGTTACVLADNKGITVDSLTLGASAILSLTNTQAITLKKNNTCLTLGASASLTHSGGSLVITLTGSCTPFSLGVGYSWIISGTRNITMNTTTDGVIITLPSIVISCSTASQFAIAFGFNTTINFTGDFNIGTCQLFTRASGGTSTLNFASGGSHAFTLGEFNNGSNATNIYNFGGSTFNISSWNGAYTGGTTTINFQTSTWNCSGNWLFGSNHTITHSTDLVTFTNTASITSSGKSFNNVTLNASGKVITFIDNAIINSLTASAGTLSMNGVQISVVGNASFAPSTTLTKNATSYFLFNGSGTQTLASGGKSLPQCTFNNNFAIQTACTIYRLIWGVDGFTGTFDSGATYIISNLTASDWNGSVGNLNALRSSSTGNQFTLTIPNIATLQYMNPQDCIVSQIITVNDKTSLNGGNNSGWIFPVKSKIIWIY